MAEITIPAQSLGDFNVEVFTEWVLESDGLTENVIHL